MILKWQLYSICFISANPKCFFATCKPFNNNTFDLTCTASEWHLCLCQALYWTRTQDFTSQSPCSLASLVRLASYQLALQWQPSLSTQLSALQRPSMGRHLSVLGVSFLRLKRILNSETLLGNYLLGCPNHNQGQAHSNNVVGKNSQATASVLGMWRTHQSMDSGAQRMQQATTWPSQ